MQRDNELSPLAVQMLPICNLQNYLEKQYEGKSRPFFTFSGASDLMQWEGVVYTESERSERFLED